MFIVSGKKDKNSVKSIIGIGLKISIAASIIVFIAVYFFPSQILEPFTDKPDILASAIEYSKIICCTYVFYCIANMLAAAMRCVELVKVGMAASLSALLINVSLNWVLIFGNLGMPKMGIKGAAIATLISRIVEMSFMVIYVFVFDKKLQIKLRELLKNDLKLLKDFVKYGLPITFGSLTWGINLAVQGIIVGHLSKAAIAAVSISNNVFSLITVGIYGLASASGIIIGKAVGAGDIDLVKQYSRTLQIIFIINGIITGIIMFLTRGAVISLYKGMGADTLRYASQFIIVLSVMAIGTSYQMSGLTGIVRPGGATNFVLINDLLFVWIIVLPLSSLAAFVFNAEPWVVVACLKCDQILKCAVAAVKINKFDWIKNLTR